MSKLRDLVEKSAASLLKAVEQEASGESHKNTTRLTKGKYLTELERLGNKLKTAGEELDDGATPIQFARDRVASALFDKGVTDVALDDAEVSIARKAYKSVENEGGLTATFEDIYAVNPATGGPLVDDAGKPLVRPVTAVPVNRIYWVADYCDYDFGAAMSFARRTSEKDLRTFHRLAKKRPKSEVFRAISDLMTGQAETVVKLVAEELGLSEDKPQFKNITVPVEIFDGSYHRTREMASLVLGFLGRGEVLDSDSRVQPGILMEHLLDLVDPLAHGPWSLLAALTRSGAITTKEAAQVKVSWTDDGLAERWESVMATGELPAFEDIFPEEEPATLADEVLSEVERTPW